METIYSSNEINVHIERMDKWESKVYINGLVAIWISNETKEEFVKDLVNAFEKHRI